MKRLTLGLLCMAGIFQLTACCDCEDKQEATALEKSTKTTEPVDAFLLAPGPDTARWEEVPIARTWVDHYQNGRTANTSFLIRKDSLKALLDLEGDFIQVYLAKKDPTKDTITLVLVSADTANGGRHVYYPAPNDQTGNPNRVLEHIIPCHPCKDEKGKIINAPVRL